MKSQALILGIFLMAAIVLSGCTTAQQGAQGPTGPQGERGAIGPSGPSGAQGLPGISGYEIVRKEVSTSNKQFKILKVECPQGKKVIGGGCSFSGTDESLVIVSSNPTYPNLSSGYTYGWNCAGHNQFTDFPGSFELWAFAICANVES
ncbi:MAG: collagen-like protein [Candidatus Diapherotrites archaeon]|uniref:Collagen-like protein n=1 Tax=Candidatus Iainarchaeum sp. TaxID=3101447 RepID=A0A8T3YN05_9ARCH|nr:collagen-like protein [Candidatus Diapherotrites archaeon]